jgi:DNA-binding GntR family transcriptional regulator
MDSPALVFSLREQIANYLRTDVLCGRISEGEKLSEVSLAERFGVSRTPIREALQQLTHEGLLEGRPNQGVKVAPRAPDSVRELLIPIRRSLEAFALRSFFDEINGSDFRCWDEILDKLRAACIARDYAAIAEQDIALHRSIVRRAGLPDLEAIWAAMVARIRSYFWETQRRNYADPLQIYEEHAGLINVFRDQDIEAAANALESHIEMIVEPLSGLQRLEP